MKYFYVNSNVGLATMLITPFTSGATQTTLIGVLWVMIGVTIYGMFPKK